MSSRKPSLPGHKDSAERSTVEGKLRWRLEHLLCGQVGMGRRTSSAELSCAIWSPTRADLMSSEDLAVTTGFAGVSSTITTKISVLVCGPSGSYDGLDCGDTSSRILGPAKTETSALDSTLQTHRKAPCFEQGLQCTKP